MTTLVSDDVHFRGSLLAAPRWPFATTRSRRSRRPRCSPSGPGLISAGPALLPAPVIERYAGKPWPQTGF